MSPQRRTALVSVAAACALIALKLGTGLATGSLGLLSEASAGLKKDDVVPGDTAFKLYDT